MKQCLIEAYSKIPQPDESYQKFIEDLKAENPAPSHEISFSGCVDEVPETALASLKKSKQTLPVTFVKDPSCIHEEYQLENTENGATITAGDADGFRYGVYFLEDHVGRYGSWRRKPFVKHRISRCFFGPTYRPPFLIDELSNDIDYYPEGYLDKLAHENINGLWLTMYFRDLPSSIFPNRGKGAEKRFAKLRKTVEKCGRYGIRLYIYFCEPKGFREEAATFAESLSDVKDYPDIPTAPVSNGYYHFCLSSETGRKYLHESVKNLFDAVPDLGGIINIVYGEDNGSCKVLDIACSPVDRCPVCAERDSADLYHDYINSMVSAMPESAEFIGWFYAPAQRDGLPESKNLLHTITKYPENATCMFNIESGVRIEQLGKKRSVFDYSLACIQPSELFRQMTQTVKKPGAKIQVGCSHEDASVPFVPVPSNLYEKYKFMYSAGVSAVLQCWYFGNYPGLMNKSAGYLSFAPFPESEEEFLKELLYPLYGEHAETAAEAFKLFARGYRQFPGNLSFEWYGPMHHCIAWPWHLYPVDQPISPSWILKSFPEVSGDRIGECLTFNHTLKEARILMEQMREDWQKGFEILEPIRNFAPGDADVAETLLIQIKSTCNLLEFYDLREDMLYTGVDNLVRMKELVVDEIALTERMIVLCERDSRLGYHSEAEGYLFFPERLKERAKLLHVLLEEDFPTFKPEENMYDFQSGLIAKHTGNTLSDGTVWNYTLENDVLKFTFDKHQGKKMYLEIEPCRMWKPLEIIFQENGTVSISSLPLPMPLDDVIKTTPDSVEMPLSVFDGFRREGYPIRLSVRIVDGHGKTIAAWKDGVEDWPPRLMQNSWNPNRAGILPLD